MWALIGQKMSFGFSIRLYKKKLDLKNSIEIQCKELIQSHTDPASDWVLISYLTKSQESFELGIGLKIRPKLAFHPKSPELRWA